MVGVIEKKRIIMLSLKPGPSCFDFLWQNYLHTLLEARGEAVGLPAGQMGNSEIGHTTIGAGKVIYSDQLQISRATKNE